MREAREWEGELDDLTGLLADQHLPTEGWYVDRRVALRDGALVLDAKLSGSTDAKSAWRRVLPQRGLLEKFATLAQANDSKILAFARTWGLLWLCQHGLPGLHWHEPPRLHPKARRKRGPGLNLDDQLLVPCTAGIGPEALSAWRFYAGACAAILTIAARLHRGESGGRDTWNALLLEEFNDAGLWFGASGERDTEDEDRRRNREAWDLLVSRNDDLSLRVQREALSLLVNRWLSLGQVRPVVDWVESRTPKIELASPVGLFGALGVQMMSAIA